MTMGRWDRLWVPPAGFHHLTSRCHPSQNSQQAPPCSGILQVRQALSHSVTCSVVSSGSQARSKSRKWPTVYSSPGSGPFRPRLESFLDNLCRWGDIFVPQIPHLLSEVR